VFVASIGAVLVVLAVLAALAVVGVVPRSARPVPGPVPPPVPTSTVPATPAASTPPPTPQSPAPVDDLGLGVPEVAPECDGSYIVIVGSAVTPERYSTDVAALLAAHPGSHYVRTARSCGSFQDVTASGDPIYAVYLGPYSRLGDACSARSIVGFDSMVREVSSAAPTAFPTC
jgi:hypothetical protein